jgi:ribose transport system permease protein
MAEIGITEALQRIRYKWSFQLFIAELLQKRWMEPVVPFTAALAVILAFSVLIPGYLTFDNMASTGRQFGEFGFVAIAAALVIISGGIDLSVGSIFAVANFVALMMFNMFELPAPLAILIALASGAVMGAINGLLIGFVHFQSDFEPVDSQVFARDGFVER